MITYSIYTSAGSRPVNEDSAAVFENNGRYCFILCDGLGGHGMGDAASQLVTRCFGEYFQQSDSCGDFLAPAFEIAQGSLLGEQRRLGAERKMKTTAVCAVTDGASAFIGHVGDSRFYCFRRNKVKMRTLDHSVPQMLVMSREIKESEIRNHPDRSLLLRVMGVPWEEPKYELEKPVPLHKCQAFLLCSDGFWELIDESDMCSTLKNSNNVQEWLISMSEIVRRNGEGRDMDNNTAIAVWTDQK